MESIKKIYGKRKLKYEELIKRQTQTVNFISVLRLIVFAAFLGFALYFFIKRIYLYSAVLIAAGITSFLFLVIKHSKLIRKRRLAEGILRMNNISIERIEGQWKEFKDKGEEFLEENHSYTSDLDIFGQGSLYQWMNCSNTPMGRKVLSEKLSNPVLDKKVIIEVQRAVQELSYKIGLRQRLQAEGSFIISDNEKVTELFQWAEDEKYIINSKLFRLMLILLSSLCVATAAAYLFFHVISYGIPLMFIGINLLLLKIFQQKRSDSLDTIYKYKKSLMPYMYMLSLIECQKFNSQLLNQFQGGLRRENTSAAKEINRLVSICSRISDRNNFFTIILNVILLWDFHLIKLLENWKKDNGKHIMQWLRVLGEFEALSSLSIVDYEHPNWQFPLIEEGLSLEARDAAHPLLASKAVSNSIAMNRDSGIILITGSNMSGKSTFLRTLGVNLILAYAGAKVCASSFSCGLMNIYSCMRIGDNLEKNISSFYAEILRIKQIVSAVNEGKKVFFLLDEIFKGTNSLDRHMGAEALIDRLSTEESIGLVSTHDLELGDLEQKNSKVKNYHFQEYYKEDEIHFDYKLRKGISTTRNAKFLMKLAGIEFEQ